MAAINPDLLATTGVAELGYGLFHLYKQYSSEEKSAPIEDAKENVNINVEHPQIQTEQVGCGSSYLSKNVAQVRQEMQTALHNQAYLAALFSKGVAEVYAGLEHFQQEMNKGFDNIIATIGGEAARRNARELRMHLEIVTVAYDSIMDDVLLVAESKDKRFPAYVSKDAEEAKRAATNMYAWAKSFLPEKMDGETVMEKQTKFEIMPYIVAMAYAIRVRMDACEIESEMMERAEDRATYLDKSRKIVNQFISLLVNALEALMANTSLLEIALDYHIHMSTYLTLLMSFQSSLDMALSSDGKRKGSCDWDDGLSIIRAIVHRGSDNKDLQKASCAISLSKFRESCWWAEFTGEDLDTLDTIDLKKSIDVSDLCYALGVDLGDGASEFRVRPEQAASLTQLPSVTDLRFNLCSKVWSALALTQQGTSLPSTFARVRTAAEMQTCPAPICTTAEPETAPAHLEARQVNSLSGHNKWVWGVAVSADGERLISGSGDMSARVWSCCGGKALNTISTHTDRVHCVALSPDGTMAVSGSADNTVRVWSVDSGDTRHILRGHRNSVYAVAVSPDGSTIASTSSDMTVKLWDAHTGKEKASLAGHTGSVWCVAFSPDGERLVSGSSDTSIKVWNVHTCQLERTLQGHSRAVRGVAVTPDGCSLVSGSWDETVKVWSLSSGTEEMTFRAHTGAVNCIAILPEGQRIVSGGVDSTIRVWNLRSRTLELTLAGHTNDVLSVAASSDAQTLVSSSSDKSIKVWSLSPSTK